MKKLIAASLGVCAMSGAVLAQTSPPPTTSSPSPSVTTTPSMPSPAVTPSVPPAPIAPNTSASTKVMPTPPAQSASVTNWYKQTVYDSANASVGQIMDVLLQPDGKVSAVIVGVGGFLGMGDHSVAVPFSAVTHTMRDGKTHLTMEMTKDALKNAPGLRYDSATTTWVPDTK